MPLLRRGAAILTAGAALWRVRASESSCAFSHNPTGCCQKRWTLEDLASGRFVFYDPRCATEGGDGCGALGVEDCRFCVEEASACDAYSCTPCPLPNRWSSPVGCECLGGLTSEERDELEAEGATVLCDPRCAADADPVHDPYFPSGCGYAEAGPVCRKCFVDASSCAAGDFSCVPCDALPRYDGGNADGGALGTDGGFGGEFDGADGGGGAAADVAQAVSCGKDADCYGSRSATSQLRDELEAAGLMLMCSPLCAASAGGGSLHGCLDLPDVSNCRTCSLSCQAWDRSCNICPGYEAGGGGGGGGATAAADATPPPSMASSPSYPSPGPLPPAAGAGTYVGGSFGSYGGGGTCVSTQDCYNLLAAAHPLAVDNLEAWGKQLVCDSGCSASPPTLEGYQCNYFGVARDCRACWTEHGVALHLLADPTFPADSVARCPLSTPGAGVPGAGAGGGGGSGEPGGAGAGAGTGVGSGFTNGADACVGLGDYCAGPFHTGATQCCDSSWRCIPVSTMHSECVRP